MVLLLKGLMGLGLVKSAFAVTPVVAEPILSRDLEVRQADKCPDTYTSSNGMNFTSYCGQNNPQNDAVPFFTSPSMQDCMEHCSRFWGKSEGCFGIVWVAQSSECWIRNSTVSTAGLIPLEDNYSALVVAGEMDPGSTDCPADDGSTHTLDGIPGLAYTVNCGKVIDGQDACFSGYNECWVSPYKNYFHTETLDACVRICVDQHPLCKAVSWNPGLEIGFANCWLKTDFSSAKLITPPADYGVMHTATITSIDRIDTTCPTKTSYTAPNKKIFDINCGQSNAGSNITNIHSQNITSCMDACAASDKSCIGIVFDSSLQFGYNNCALQSTSNIVTTQSQATYAALSSETAASTPSSSTSSGSKAWIAGPVIGGIAALALLAFALLWWRRRKAKKAPYVQKDAPPPATGPVYTAAPAYSPTGSTAPPLQQQGGYYDAPLPVPQPLPASEMSEGRERNELPASTKYAGKGGVPQELPS
ncbi:hypothetical protein P153DRAFT_349095 [Dothidotthia symphoricarpi CBS 119687]|uniref:Apple domain-containing protein n=1 Tax=Dothidotthia symphoricarpi CBS 119687 TaxID=1392245 RepID=A0A6A6A204_9PLEO|nr:uncharacterized protein P153DRAFT_349095 [Dothidotthia symphoricarpi CBS 119687]KAF2124967.1 hypothetical protein P153DRAFT_349095 [Dothidotthia symphoricarpi CBS 119687]